MSASRDPIELSATTIELAREASSQLAKLIDIIKKLEESAGDRRIDQMVQISHRPGAGVGERTAPQPRIQIELPDMGLTKREQQVLRLLIEGLTNRLIARTLGIAEATVKNHLHSIFMKLKVTGRAQVIAMILSGRATPPPTEGR
ncbi:LuxR C-terminal-related transcriptional regulator [Nocardia sp. NPDC050175]|uniref:LuxR C-terminal-related transcriptional regulator n=1 Tax=Nocardia sp. NPDC050175 TaxID=3364317 RepID=UPI003788AC47